jgi:hypothetical protein
MGLKKNIFLGGTMKRIFVILLILFTGLLAFGGQSINGPGIQVDGVNAGLNTGAIGFVGMVPAINPIGYVDTAVITAAAFYNIESAPTNKTAVSSHDIIGTPLAVDAYDVQINYGLIGPFDCTGTVHPRNGIGGVAVFDGVSKPGDKMLD